MQVYEKNEVFLKEQHAHDKKILNSEVNEDVPILFLKKGTTLVRVLPPYSAKGVWFRELLEHGLEVNGRFQSYTCLRQYGLPCPFCEEGERLYGSGDPENIKLATDRYRPKTNYLFNVLVLSSPDGHTVEKGVHVLKAGKMVKRQLLDLDMDNVCCGDITSLEKGFNIRIERRGDKLKTEYVVRNLPERTNLQAELASKNVDINSLELIDLDTMYPPKDYNYLKSIASGTQTAPGFPAISHQPVLEPEGIPVKELEPQIAAQSARQPVQFQTYSPTQQLGHTSPGLTGGLANPVQTLKVRNVPRIPDPPKGE